MCQPNNIQSYCDTHTHDEIQFSTVVSVAVTIWDTHTHRSTEVDLKNGTHLEDKKPENESVCTQVFIIN